MSPAINASMVTNLIDAMRREAEKAIGSVTSSLSTAAGKTAIAKVVAGFYNEVEELGHRVMAAHRALAQRMATNPSAQVQAAFASSIQLVTYWNALANGFATYVREATPEEAAGRPKTDVGAIAVAVIVVAVAGAVAFIAVSVTGCAWAIVHYSEAANLRKEIEVLEANPETAAALAAINAGGGRGPSGPGGDGPSTGTMIAVGVGVVGAIGGAIWFFSRPKG